MIWVSISKHLDSPDKWKRGRTDPEEIMTLASHEIPCLEWLKSNNTKYVKGRCNIIFSLYIKIEPSDRQRDTGHRDM